MKYLASTFSPSMLEGGSFYGMEVTLGTVQALAQDAKSIVSHEVTACVLTGLLGFPVAFNRETVKLKKGDEVFCVIPQFRGTEAREYTRQEVEKAGVKAYCVQVFGKMEKVKEGMDDRVLAVSPGLTPIIKPDSTIC